MRYGKEIKEGQSWKVRNAWEEWSWCAGKGGGAEGWNIKSAAEVQVCVAALQEARARALLNSPRAVQGWSLCYIRWGKGQYCSPLQGKPGDETALGRQGRCFDSLSDCHPPSDIASWIRMEFTPRLRVAGGFFVVLSTLEEHKVLRVIKAFSPGIC